MLYTKSMSDSPFTDEKRAGQAGPVIATIVIALLLALGGIYFLVTQEFKLHQPNQTEQYNS